MLFLAGILALVAVFFICLVPIAVTDFWWQLKTGELIVREGRIPDRDVFSWTAAGQPWMVHEWLTEVLFYLVYRYLPKEALLFYKCGLAAVACGLVLLRARMRSGSTALGVGAALATALVMRNYADLRPQMLTFILLAGLLLCLDLYHRGELPRLPWALPFVFILWANLHGGVVVGLVLVGLWVLGEAMGQAWFRRPSPGLAPLAGGVAAASVAVALNPHGFMVYTYPFQVLGHPQVMDYISEWWSPNFHNTVMRPFEVVLLATFGVAAVAPAGARGRLGEMLVLVAMAHAALTSQRNTVPFAIAATPLLAAGLVALWQEAEPLDVLREYFAVPAVRAVGSFLLVVFTSVIIVAYWPRVAPDRWYSHAIHQGYFPESAVRLMKRGHWPGKLYNDYVWGGYLIWELYPQRPVFIDGRAEVYYPTKAFDDEMKIHNVAAGWDQALDRREVEVVLTSKTGALASALARHPKWKLAFTGKVEVVYTRNPDA